MRISARRAVAVAGALVLAVSACGRGDDGGGVALTGACKGQQTTGITDTSIKVGGAYPLSGPTSAYAEIPRGVRAHFDYLNAEKGGINGRKIEYVVRDTGGQPPKAVEEVRRLVEEDRVFALFQTLGTAENTAVWDYVNQRKVPHIFLSSGASKWGTDTRHPWSMGWQPNYVAEARIYAAHLKKERPNAKVAVLYQNDDLGKDLLGGFKRALADGAGPKIVAEQSYQTSDPSVEPQMRNLAASDADVVLSVTTPKFSTQALAADAKNTSWNPTFLLANVGASVTALRPVGLENVQGVISSGYYKDPPDPQWADDPGMKLFKEKMLRYGGTENPNDPFNAFGWAAAESWAKAMQAAKCPTREGLRAAAENLGDVQIGMLLPGITLGTGPGDRFPIESMQLMRFEGERWQTFGDIIDTREEFGAITG
ncbi:ABC transporter substrate-binding protein [Streptosporangium oxazolinicum]|uniref:ABC transporter substrate-binding protein n=1 Tax=Streptosporangium oxazolinicum TaxID=909287 RepID=A0ABP8BN08_9ACTN